MIIDSKNIKILLNFVFYKNRVLNLLNGRVFRLSCCWKYVVSQLLFYLIREYIDIL